MFLRSVCSIAAALSAFGFPDAAIRADEPAPARAAPVAKVKAAAGEKPAAAPAAAKIEKPVEKKGAERRRSEPVGVDVEAFAAPILRVLVGNLNRARPAPAAVAVAANDAVAQQYIAQLRPILLAELAFVRQLCDLTPEQRPVIRAAGEAGLKEAARAMANQRQPQVRVLGGSTASTEPRVIIRQAVEKAVLATVSEDQRSEFQAEANKRAEFRQRAAIRYVVSRLDSTLFLTAEQRDEVEKTLTGNWQDEWENWLMLQAYGDRYFPSIPDQYVVRPLNPEQVAVWRGLQKISLRGSSINNGVAVEEDGWWGEPLNVQGAADAFGVQ